MSTQAITFSEMMQSPIITRIVNRIQTPLSLFQRMFNVMSGDNSKATESIKGREAGWDIFDKTRQFATARSPEAGPIRVRKKPIGHQSAALMRSHESILILDEEVYKARPLGGQVGTLDLRGQQYIQRQVEFMTQRFRNQREWMLSRMLRGGFNMDRTTGDFYKLKNYNAGATDEIKVDYQIPADNKTRMQLGTGSNILTDWSLPTADIVGQLYKVNAGYSRIHGRPLRHIWVNSNTFTNIQNNDALQELGGQSVTVFESLTSRSMKSAEGIPDAGFDVKFRALPLFTFHVYDGVLSADGDTDGTSTTDMEKLIPDDYAIMLPEVDNTWFGLIDGSEVIAENVMAAGREAQGFATWSTRVIDPPGFELKFLDNYLPVLYVPSCVGYGYVGA